MYTVTGKVLEVKEATGKGPRKVVLLSEDGRFDKAFVDVMDKGLGLTVGKVVSVPVTISLNEYKGKTYLNVTAWAPKGGK